MQLLIIRTVSNLVHLDDDTAKAYGIEAPALDYTEKAELFLTESQAWPDLTDGQVDAVECHPVNDAGEIMEDQR